jgi:hypothetical protein
MGRTFLFAKGRKKVVVVVVVVVDWIWERGLDFKRGVESWIGS